MAVMSGCVSDISHKAALKLGSNDAIALSDPTTVNVTPPNPDIL